MSPLQAKQAAWPWQPIIEAEYRVVRKSPWLALALFIVGCGICLFIEKSGLAPWIFGGVAIVTGTIGLIKFCQRPQR